MKGYEHPVVRRIQPSLLLTGHSAPTPRGNHRGQSTHPLLHLLDRQTRSLISANQNHAHNRTDVANWLRI